MDRFIPMDPMSDPERRINRLNNKTGESKMDRNIKSKEEIQKMMALNEEINNLYNKFNKVTEVKNLYNRCILYDAHEYHTGTNYFTNDRERLSLVFFFTNLTSSIPPKDRVMYFDKEIEYNILNCKNYGKNSKNHT